MSDSSERRSAAKDHSEFERDFVEGENEQRRGTLTRQDIVEAIVEKNRTLSKREIKRLVDGVIDEMVETLVRGETLKLHDFGSFVVRGKGHRSGRNPRTGEKVPIEPRQVVVFKASPMVKAAMNPDAVKKSVRRPRAG